MTVSLQLTGAGFMNYHDARSEGFFEIFVIGS